MQLPLWFSLWQSLDSLLAIALNAAEAFPFLLFLCLFLFRSRRAPFLADSGRIFSSSASSALSSAQATSCCAVSWIWNSFPRPSTSSSPFPLSLSPLRGSAQRPRSLPGLRASFFSTSREMAHVPSFSPPAWARMRIQPDGSQKGRTSFRWRFYRVRLLLRLHHHAQLAFSRPARADDAAARGRSSVRPRLAHDLRLAYAGRRSGHTGLFLLHHKRNVPECFR